MGTDDFLKTFGNGAKEKASLVDRLNPAQVRNYLQTQTSQTSGQNDENFNKFRNMTMYSDDIAAQTMNQIASNPNTEQEAFYKDALKTGIDSNITSIRKYFAQKTPPKPFSNYEAPTIPEHPFSDAQDRSDLPGARNIARRNQDLPGQTLSSMGLGRDQEQTIEDLSNNIVNILSKAIEKAAPKFEAQRPLARPETAKVTPSHLFNNDRSIAASQKDNIKSETKGKPKIDLDGFYRNFGMLQTNPTIYQDQNETEQPKDSLEESIANDLSQYLRILNSQRNTTVNQPDLQASEKSEGEVDLTEFKRHQMFGTKLGKEPSALQAQYTLGAIEKGQMSMGFDDPDPLVPEQDFEEGELMRESDFKGISSNVFDVI